MAEVNNMLVKPQLRQTERYRDTTPNTQAEAYYLRGQIFEKKTEYQLAMRDYQLALNINP